MLYDGDDNNNDDDDSNDNYNMNDDNNDNDNYNRIERRKSRFFYNLRTAPRTVSNTYAQVARAQSCANHVQHIARFSRTTCRVPRGTKGQLSYQV